MYTFAQYRDSQIRRIREEYGCSRADAEYGRDWRSDYLRYLERGNFSAGELTPAVGRSIARLFQTSDCCLSWLQFAQVYDRATESAIQSIVNYFRLEACKAAYQAQVSEFRSA